MVFLITRLTFAYIVYVMIILTISGYNSNRDTFDIIDLQHMGSSMTHVKISVSAQYRLRQME